jgi:hypothetical protein
MPFVGTHAARSTPSIAQLSRRLLEFATEDAVDRITPGESVTRTSERRLLFLPASGPPTTSPTALAQAKRISESCSPTPRQ